VTCTLTPHGEEMIEQAADIIRDGGSVTHPIPILTDNGFRHVGDGDSRIVFTADDDPDTPAVSEGGDCVVKLTMFTDPWQNGNEIINWEYAPDEIQHLLAPITQRADDGLWLVMPKAEGLDVESGHYELLNEMEDAGYALVDVRWDHVGLINGDPKIIDYGHRITTLNDERIGPKQSEFEGIQGYGYYDRLDMDKF
jgi:hypothetical protein